MSWLALSRYLGGPHFSNHIFESIELPKQLVHLLQKSVFRFYGELLAAALHHRIFLLASILYQFYSLLTSLLNILFDLSVVLLEFAFNEVQIVVELVCQIRECQIYHLLHLVLLPQYSHRYMLVDVLLVRLVV